METQIKTQALILETLILLLKQQDVRGKTSFELEDKLEQQLVIIKTQLEDL